MKTLTAAAQQQSAGGGPFNPLTSIDWFAFYYAEGPETTDIYSNGMTMSAWPNEKLNGDLAQGSSVLEPTYRSASSIFNSQPAVEFRSGDNMQMATNYGTLPSYANGNYVTICAGVSFNALSSNQFIWDGRTLSDQCWLRVSSGSWYYYNGITLDGIYSTTVSTATPYLVWVEYTDDGVAERLYIDNVAVDTVDTGSQAVKGLSVGADYQGNSPLDFDCAFIGIYEGRLSGSGQAVAFNDWFQTKYTTGGA
jgi:hypothetical protein